MNVFESEEDFWAESAYDLASARPSHVWQVGDRVRVMDGPRMLLGAVGMVVEVDLPGAWPVRVHIGQRGFGRALLAAHELGPADRKPTNNRGTSPGTGCSRASKPAQDPTSHR
ncbi:hypothetical protein [Myceligenerans pegani]|uniref:Uncharacterized protein n=1 Tax=Myceligenerans pegani TaxID=2776917 RepID=A0ABR9MTW1_9MICO|nr:hypothetical protein [Myceligenerans sp. TRM 65318]MBE1874804.1 hypothetical protein [Myceligenerans sp. TRM 65318]MBE3017075.1 hypothetical protein [Myceligenerans sp. TRM 65318]